MKKYYSFLIIITFLSLSFLSFRSAENKIGPMLGKVLSSSAENNFVVWVYFKDKGPNAMSELSSPLQIVSQRSLDRRSKVKPSGELLDYSDIPLYSAYVNEVASSVTKIRHGAKWLNSMSAEVNREQIQTISNFDFVTKIELVERFKMKKENVEYSSDNSPVFINSNSNVDAPLADSLSYGTQSALTQITQIKVNLVHNQGIYGQGVMVASFDAGFSNLTHEVFTTLPMKIRSRYDFQTHSTTLTGHSHGTATLSLVGGYKPGQMIGPAFMSDFILARTEVDPTETPVEMDNWIAAAHWADSLGADVITSSLGYLDFDPPYTSYTWQDMNGNTLPITIAADLAVNKGIIVSNSAGNNGSDVHNTLGGPADGDSVITIGSVNSSGTRSNFSSIGPTTDVPPRIKPDLMAMGSNNYIADVTGNLYDNGSGTSFSCPLASGVCALVLSANKTLTPMQVRGILRKFASRTNTPDNNYGWGIIDASLSVDSARKLDNTPPVILHSQPFTSTVSNDAVVMKAKITDNGIIRNWTNQAPLLYYRKSTDAGVNWTPFASVTSSLINLDTFSFSIPGSVNGTYVQYYFAAQDIAIPPKMSSLPAGGTGTNPPGVNPPPNVFVYSVGVIGIEPVSTEIPSAFTLYDNYPNPFNPSTKIRFDIAKQTRANLFVYDILGRLVNTIVNEDLKAGKYEVSFDGASLSSGIYFYRLETDQFTETKKMLMVK